MGRPSKTCLQPLVFEYQGDKHMIPDQHQDALRAWFAQQDDKSKCLLSVRCVDSIFEYNFANDGQHIQGIAKTKLPVKDIPMKILAIHRRKNGRGASFEIDLEGEGRYKAPITTTKHLVAYLQNNEGILPNCWQKGFSAGEPSMVDLSSYDYFIEHKREERGRVSGGKGDQEELIDVVKREQSGTFQLVLTS